MLERIHFWLAGITERRILVIAAILLFLPMFKPGCSSSIEDYTIRATSEFASEDSEQSKLQIIAIDERTFNTYGPWPGPAKAVTEAIGKLRDMSPRLIVVDDSSDGGRFDLVSALPKSTAGEKIIVGYPFYAKLSDLPAGYAKKTAGKVPAGAEQMALPSSPSDDYALPSMAGVDLEAIQGSTRRAQKDGFSNLFEDPDGIVRTQPLAVRLGHRSYPALALATAAQSKGFTPLIVTDASGKPEAIALGDEKMQISPDSRMGIPFRGKAGTFTDTSIVDVIAGNIKPDDITDEVVLIGFVDPNVALMVDTPFGKMPSVEVLANTLAGLLELKSTISLTGIIWSAAAMLFALLIYAIGIVRLKLPARLAWTFVVIFLVWAVAIPLYTFTGILIPATQVTAFLIAFLIVSAAWRLFVIEVPRRFRMRTFTMRIAPEALERAIRKPGAIIARGLQRDIVALAFDIRGYAAITGTSGQDELCALMREYRTVLARTLIKHGAFIDSWAGDECRAAFGAIMPSKGHELDACRAAFDAVRTFTRMREDVSKRYGVERIRLGVGVASGKAGVGNLGPRGVSDIGITGEAMERALTLRALNKTYRTFIIVDEVVREAAENSFSFRPLDPVLAPGQDRIVHIHELVGKTGIILPHYEKYMEAREAYLRGEFEMAAHLFALILAEHPHDGPSSVLMKRARTLSNMPPKGDWKGVWGAQ